jgi:hypothetical protein
MRASAESMQRKRPIRLVAMVFALSLVATPVPAAPQRAGHAAPSLSANGAGGATGG